MYPNKESGLGSKMANALFDNAMFNNPSTGRVFIVAKAALANINEIKSLYGTSYADGTPVVYTTIALAVAQCVAARGDLILVAPGHTESIASNTALTMSISGVAVVGLGIGAQRPVITLDTANTATINVTAAGVSFKNCVFVANFAAVAAAFTLTTATDFQLLSCEFRDTDASHNFIALVVTATTANAADGLVIDGCKAFLLATSGAVKMLSALGTIDRATISNNYFASLTTNAGAIIVVATGKILTNFRLLNNLFNLQNAAGTGTGYIITTDGSTNTGFIHGNYDHALPTTPLFCTGSSGFVYGANYHSDQADLQGYLVPGADV